MKKKQGIKIISVIPARGGSKGLPGKNIVLLKKKPLLAYTIEASIASGYIARTVVSTDSEEIRRVALKYKAQAPFLRPAELATDTAHSPDVVEHAVKFYEETLKEKFDIVIMLQPTSPFRTAKHIDQAVEKFLSVPGLDSLISVKKQEYPPWWMFKIEKNRLAAAFEFKKGTNVFNLERQQFPAVYRPNGAIYITWRKYLRKTISLVNPENNGFYIMENKDSIDIDTPADLYEAEILLKNNRPKQS